MIGAQTAGGALGGAANAREAANQRRLQSGMFSRTQGLNEGAGALDMQSRITSAPLRDQIMAMLSARMGAPPAPFAPRDPLQNPEAGGGAASGGSAPGMAAMQAAAGRYQPGAGGVSTSVEQELLKRLGYVPGDPRAVKFAPGGHYGGR